MKRPYLFVLFILIITAKISAQSEGAFLLNRLPEQDTLLTSWKMFAGDDPEFANPSFDDSKWQPIDLNQDITILFL